MIAFVAATQAVENGDGFFFRRLVYGDGLKPSFQCGIFFDILLILGICRGTYKPYLSPCQHRLENIRRIYRTLCRTCSDYIVYFIDKNDNVTVVSYFIKHTLEPFLKIASVFCTCKHRCDVKHIYLFRFQFIGYVTACNSHCKALRNGGLSHSCLAYKAGVVFRAS